MVSSLTLTGGALGDFLEACQGWQPTWLSRLEHPSSPLADINQHAKEQNPGEASSAEIVALAAARQIQRRNLIVASTALALAAVGGLTVASLKLAALPVLVYMGIPAAQRVYDALADEEALPALLETAALGMTLAQGAILPGALGFSCYYLSRTWWLTRAEKAARLAPVLALPITVCVRRTGGDIAVPAEQVQPHEHIVYAAGDLIAVAGRVVEGVAWIQCTGTTSSPASLPSAVVKPGESVTIGNLVLTGTLVVECS